MWYWYLFPPACSSLQHLLYMGAMHRLYWTRSAAAWMIAPSALCMRASYPDATRSSLSVSRLLINNSIYYCYWLLYLLVVIVLPTEVLRNDALSINQSTCLSIYLSLYHLRQDIALRWDSSTPTSCISPVMVRTAWLNCDQWMEESGFISCRARKVALKGCIRSREYLLSGMRTIAGCAIKIVPIPIEWVGTTGAVSIL